MASLSGSPGGPERKPGKQTGAPRPRHCLARASASVSVSPSALAASAKVAATAVRPCFRPGPSRGNVESSRQLSRAVRRRGDDKGTPKRLA